MDQKGIEVAVKYNCGCGFITMSAEEAVAHSKATGHSLAVLGTIRNLGKTPESKRYLLKGAKRLLILTDSDAPGER